MLEPYTLRGSFSSMCPECQVPGCFLVFFESCCWSNLNLESPGLFTLGIVWVSFLSWCTVSCLVINRVTINVFASLSNFRTMGTIVILIRNRQKINTVLLFKYVIYTPRQMISLQWQLLGVFSVCWLFFQLQFYSLSKVMSTYFQ